MVRAIMVRVRVPESLKMANHVWEILQDLTSSVVLI